MLTFCRCQQYPIDVYYHGYRKKWKEMEMIFWLFSYFAWLEWPCVVGRWICLKIGNRSFNPLYRYQKSDFQRRRYENEFSLLDYSYWHFGMISSVLCDGRVHHLESFNRLSRMIYDYQINYVFLTLYGWPVWLSRRLSYSQSSYSIWSPRPSRYIGWSSIFLRVINIKL